MSILQSLKDMLKNNTNEKTMSDKQIRIIISAIELFSKKGFEATTTNEIAKKANVAEGTIYRYFKSKKDILLSFPSVLPVSQLLLNDINKIFEEKNDSVEEFLKNVILNRRNFAKENIAIIKVLFQEIPFHAELRDALAENVILPATKKFIMIIDKFKMQGKIIDLPSKQILKLITSSVIGYFFTRYIAMIDINSDEDKELEYLLKFILNGVCTTSNRGRLE